MSLITKTKPSSLSEIPMHKINVNSIYNEVYLLCAMQSCSCQVLGGDRKGMSIFDCVKGCS